MPIGSVVTRGFGAPGSANLVVTRGYALADVIIEHSLRPTPGVRVELYARAWNGSAFVETKIGAGPIPVMTARYSEAEAEIGAFSFTMPADHPRAELLDPSDEIPGARYARIFVGGEGYVFLGEITNIKRTASADGRRVLVASGWSSARELTRLKTGFGFTLTDETMADAVDAILDGTGWTAGSIASAAIATYVLEANGASRFQALTRLAEIQGFMLRFNSTTRTVDMGPLGTNPEGIRFTAIEGPISPRFRSAVSKVIPIASAQIVSESDDVRNKVRIEGQIQGVDGDALTLAESSLDTPYVRQTETGPDGRTVYFIADATSIAANGVFEEDLVRRDIRLIGTDATERERAANSLYGAAVTFILEHKDRVKTFAMTPVGLRHLVEDVDIAPVAGKYPVWFRGWRDERDGRRVWVEIDQDLYLLRRERVIDSSGRSTWALGWSTTTRELSSDDQEVASTISDLKAATAARLPMVTWGGYPPVGRLTPTGIEFAVPDNSGVIGANERKLSWFDDEAFANLRAHLFAAYNSGLDTSYFVQALKSALDGQFRWGFHDFSAAWDSYMVLNELGGGLPDIWAIYDGLTPILSFYQSGGGYRLGIWNGTSLSEVGSMKTANNGQYLIPTLGAGNAVRSGNGAYGSWSGLAGNDVTAPATPTGTGFSGASTTHNVSMPATVAAGDLLVCIMALDANPTTAPAPTGWTQIIFKANGSANAIAAHYKVAAGTEGGTTVNFTTTSPVTGAALVYRILAGEYEGVPAVSTGATGSSANPNPDAVTPTWTGRFLSIAAASTDTDAAVVTAAPSGYSGFTTQASGAGASGASLGTAYLKANTNSEDPGTFTDATSVSWSAITIAVMAKTATAEATLITGLDIVLSGTPGYVQIQLATGAIGAESVIGTYKVYTNDPTLEFAAAIPVSALARLSARLATDAAAANHNLTLHMLDQDDVA